MDIFKSALELHEKVHGKLSVDSKININSHRDLSLFYSPGVAAPAKAISKNGEEIFRYTIKSNTVAVVTNGTAVLGLGDIGPKAALPVVEGKCVLFKLFGGINAFPVCIDTKNTKEFIEIVKKTVIPFGGVSLEDIAAPDCFEIEKKLIRELDVPVFHDDQHGTSIATLAGLINALKVINKKIENCKIIILGAGAAGTAICKLIRLYGAKNIIVCDTKGAIVATRPDISQNKHKKDLAKISNPEKISGTLSKIIRGADVLIGVSGPGLVKPSMIKSMNDNAVIFAMANPVPEIMPDIAKKAGAAIVATGRSDFPNQINNVLAFPGVFKGILGTTNRIITDKMKISASKALAGLLRNPVPDKIIVDIFYKGVADAVANAIKKTENEKT